MLEAQHFSSAAASKGSFKLPEEFDGTVNEAVLHQTIRALLNNRRQGTASTKTRGEVSGGGRKPWRQKGTGRARAGTTRSPLWPGGGIVFGPHPRDYRTKVPRKVRQSARRSAFNARAREGALFVIEALEFDKPKTKQMSELLAKLELTGKKVLILTADTRLEVCRSANNIPRVNVMRYADASALDVLWADSLVVEETAFAAHALKSSKDKTVSGRERRALKDPEVEATVKPKAAPKKKSVKKPKKTDAKAKAKDGDDA
jgi:large subunit ribosomal protein L4